MALTLNEEQQYLKDTANSFFQENAPVTALRKLRDEKDPLGYSVELWQHIVELGWTSIIFPESIGGVDIGGLDFGFMGLGAILEESGRTLSASPLFSSVVLGGSAILLGGNEKQQQEYLPELINGTCSYALAAEEHAHHQPASVSLSANKVNGGFQLQGNKVFVLDGHSANKLIVVARTDESTEDNYGLSLFIVDADTPGITRTRTTLVDSRNAANIAFNRVEVPEGQLIGSLNEGYALLEQILDRARICIAAEMLGGIQELFDRTLAYLKERKQFGVPIGSFQALQHRAAKLFIEIELAKSAVLAALSALDEKSERTPILASLAKHKVSTLYQLMANEAVQLHGGIGVTDELEIGFFLKRASVTQQAFGNSAYHRARFATISGY